MKKCLFIEIKRNIKKIKLKEDIGLENFYLNDLKGSSL